jgi:hypothetical protein
MYGIDHIGMGIGGLGMLLVWLLPFVLIILVLRHFFENRQGASRQERPGHSGTTLCPGRD